MSLRDKLSRAKQDGHQEFAAKQAEEQRRKDEETARVKAQEEQRLAAEAEKDRKKAAEVFDTLAGLVRDAAARGLHEAVLADSFVSDKPEEGKPSRAITFDRKTYHLTGWQIPFLEMCAADNIPLTVVTERVDVALKGVLHKNFHLLAVDLRRL